MAALALVGTVIMGCSENDLAENSPKGKAVTLTTTISLDGSGTRALDADGKKTFAKGDQIAVLYKDANDKSQKALTAALETTDISSDGKTAKITVTLENPKAGGQLRCIYPAAMLSEDFKPESSDIDDMNTINYPMLVNKQDGTLATISSKCDLAVYDGTFTSEAELPGSIALKNRLAILALTIKDYDGNDITSTITNLEINQGSAYGYTVTRTAAAGPVYVAMMPSKNAKENITITASDGTTTLEKTAYDVTLAAKNLYPVTVTMLDMLHTPLTLEAAEDGTTITVTNGTQKTFQYAKNGGEKTTVEGTDASISLDAGDIVQFFSTNAGLSDDSNSFNILPNKKTYVYGNIMSLIDDGTEGFANDKTIGETSALSGLFYCAINLLSHDTKKLLLPATTLAEKCYKKMFSGCTGLTSLPEDLLPATTLAFNCYEKMFYECIGLTSLPADLLPAKTLADNCYYNMFYGCTGLTSLPADLLPAKTLASFCYCNMFADCTGLTELPEDLLPATTLDNYCYTQMFHGCTGLTTLPANLLSATTLNSYCYAYMFTDCSGLTTLPANLLPVTTLCNACYWGMFENCTSLTTAPDLPAQTLVGSCYHLLFDGCTKLSSVKCLATSISAYDCLGDWLKGAGTADGCERLVYVDASKTGADWQLTSSGEDGKRWSVAAIGGGMIIAN